MSTEDKVRLVGALADAGFTGFGEYSGHIHADMRPTVPRSFGGRDGNWGGWTNLSPEIMQTLQERGFRAGISGSRIQRTLPWDRQDTNAGRPTRTQAPQSSDGTQRTRTASSSSDAEVRTLAPVLDLIAITEGTGRPGSNDDNYNETLAYGQFTGGDVDLVNMTLDEIDALQTRMLRHPENRMNSSALGRYQFIRTTLREMRRVYNIPGDMKFTPEFQDWLAIQRMRQVRGLDDWQAGRLSTEAFVNNLSQEWASLPRMDGRGTYRGQRVGASAQEVVAALNAARGSNS
jgi:muramidase (phage lysozyme)